MPTLNILRGIPGSGKSTFAKAWLAEDPENRVRVNRDGIRWTQGIRDGIGTNEQEKMVSAIEVATVKAGLDAGKDVIIDATNLNKRFVTPWFKIATRYGADIKFIDIELPVYECILRDQQRGAQGGREVGVKVIKAFADRHKIDYDTGKLPQAPKQAEKLVFTPAPARDDMKPTAIIVDIDGTLANHQGIRNPYDTSKYAQDTYHENVVRIVSELGAVNHVILVSGRDSAFREVTVAWLQNGFVYYDEFYMRAEGDKRNDAIVKHDIYHEHIAPRYNVIGVFDDRGRVLRMWREIGLTTFAVGDTDNNDF